MTKNKKIIAYRQLTITSNIQVHLNKLECRGHFLFIYFYLF